ncbi:uncharacterized metal-binding protein YceD (DUF177 family) [Loktanella ponticola]|uniref:Uncharacterized metal-binding protein YceD (DUF177 family) n=1 Tax=Yoonia ponticola TaxID=1524255 RepID=A0A7W9BK13_9RHOB|nr:uncharacterized metal-binding protein YceD (DUF177 family) [Yoonia ponticola]
MADKPLTQFRMADLATRKATTFHLMPDRDALKALAAEMGIIEIRKLRLDGEIAPQGGRDWHLVAKLGATVVQECVVTLAPVVTRIDEPFTRTYVAEFEEIEASEAEMPEDDTVEPIPGVLDLNVLLAEALSLAIPPFPRAEGAEFGKAVYAEDGATPMTDEDAKPFAGLGALKAALEAKDP